MEFMKTQRIKGFQSESANSNHIKSSAIYSFNYVGLK